MKKIKEKDPFTVWAEWLNKAVSEGIQELLHKKLDKLFKDKLNDSNTR